LKTRRRQSGGERRGWLPTPADKLLFILLYVRQYLVQRVQAVLFEMNKTQADEWIHRMLPVVKRALGHEVVLPLRLGASMAEMQVRCSGLVYWLDARFSAPPRRSASITIIARKRSALP